MPVRDPIHRRALALLGCLLAAACGDAPAPPLSAVLITIDTTNPGALDIYGTDRGLTPRIAGLAAQSVVFDEARTVAPLTLPSHASMLSGLYPLRHGVRDNGLWPLPESARTIAERASGAGFQTAAFVSAVVLSAPYGLAQGFETYDEPSGRMQRMGEYMLERDATDVTTAAQRWIRERDRSRPFLLWVHYFDPHAPYEPSAEGLARAGGSAYLGEVADMDVEIGNLLDSLQGEVGFENLVIALAADHGESLGRHDEPTHSVYCYDATMRVPLVLRLPERLRGDGPMSGQAASSGSPATGEDSGARANAQENIGGGAASSDAAGVGARSDALVSVVDLYPTLIEALALGEPGPIDGRSLLPLARGEESAFERGVYVESYCGYLNYGWSGLAGWVEDGAKYLHSARPELYSLDDDPRELRDLFPTEAARAERHRRRLDELARAPRLERGVRDESGPAMDAQLRALGYAGAGSSDTELPEPLADSTRPAPRDRADELKRFYDAALLANDGRRGEAIDKLKAVADANPGNVYARDVLAGLLCEEQRFEEARALLEGLLADGHDRFTIRQQLGTSLEGLGHLEAAAEQFEAALRHLPNDEEARESLDRVRRALR